MGVALKGRIATTLLAMALTQPQIVSAQDVALLSSSEQKGASSQSLLDRAANLEVEQAWLGDALVRLQRTSGVSVAFSPTLIPDSLRVECQCGRATVKEALVRMLDGLPFTYREVGDLVSVEPRRPDPAEGRASRDAAVAVVHGRVVEEGTERPLQGAQVYIQSTTGGAGRDWRRSRRGRAVPHSERPVRRPDCRGAPHRLCRTAASHPGAG